MIGGDDKHTSIKLSKSKILILVEKTILEAKRKMAVDQTGELHICSTHSNWYSVWKFTSKSDSNFEQSETFPDMVQDIFPKTKRVIKFRIYRKTTERKSSKY